MNLNVLIESGSSLETAYTAYPIKGYKAAPAIDWKSDYKTVPDGGDARNPIKVDCTDHPCGFFTCPGYMYVSEEFISSGNSFLRAPYCGWCGKIVKGDAEEYSLEEANPNREQKSEEPVRKDSLLKRILAFLKSLPRLIAGKDEA